MSTASSSSRGASKASDQTPDKSPRKRKKRKLRPLLRAFHRDAGYFVIGLTFIYALSGLAVNHVADWDPSFVQIQETHQLGGPISGEDDAALARHVVQELELGPDYDEVYRVDDETLDILLENRTLHANTRTGEVFEEGQQPRLFLRLANWLHLNRGKEAWTFIADAYAVLLLFLATSGLFMVGGRKGLLGRGAVITAAGIAVPVLYVILSGGP